MFNLFRFILLILMCTLAVAFAAPRQIKALKSVGVNLPISMRGAIYQGVFLSVIGTVVGTALSNRTGFALISLPDLKGLSSEQGDFLLSLFATILTTLVAFSSHFIIYYLIFRPRLSADYVIISESVRIKMGVLARILQGGVVEEVQFRWGVMSGLVWLGLRLFPHQGDGTFWFGIALSSLLFSLFHLLGAVQLGIGNSTLARSVTLIDNIWVGIAFGWLFWQFGLLAAIISHAMIHVLWFPIERYYLMQYTQNTNAT